MAIIIAIDYPEDFLDEFKKRLRNDVNSNWRCDDDGDFTLMIPPFESKAWFHPYIDEKKLIFGILGRKNVMLTVSEFSAYHSIMLNVLLCNFGKEIKTIQILSFMESEYDTRQIDC